MSEPVIRNLTLEDLDSALTLSSTAGWNQRLADWRMLLALSRGGSFAAVSDGRVVGTSIGIDYEGFAWIAMMLVDPAYRGRGLGGRLLEAAMGSVPSDRPIRLDATPMGRPLYQRYGFEDEAMLTRHVADVSSRRGSRGDGSFDVRPLTVADLPTVMEYDGRVFGGDRRPLLDWALDGAPRYARVVQSDGQAHYCLGRHGRLFDQIGPVIAGTDEIAQALVSAALLSVGAQPVALDVFDSRSKFTTWLRGCGFRVERPLFRMRRGGRAPAIDEGSTYALVEFAIAGPEFA
jgi:GNAT superfamily N-acetyltransferase